ncbi:MAG: ribonuclease HII [Alphaproteobacteria bacterium]
MLDAGTHEPIAGVDEAGRGPWAGPVVVAAAILNPESSAALQRAGVNDSKALSKAARERCFAAIREEEERGTLWLSIARAEVPEIDAHNILRATLRAMTRAVTALPVTPVRALIDGNQMPELPCPGETVVRGDSRVLAIAAASIAAKVTRDRLMAALARDHPGYGWERNAGYGTAEHRGALESLGVTIHHRRSFAPIRELLERTPTSR